MAGYRIINNTGFERASDGVDAALAAGADIVVLCSSDDEYEQLGPGGLQPAEG
ncbi:MAG: hypothetical protein R2727_09200 [Bacteroidales bacterium]